VSATVQEVAERIAAGNKLPPTAARFRRSRLATDSEIEELAAAYLKLRRAAQSAAFEARHVLPELDELLLVGSNRR
jgi:hypothetical protein